MIGSYPFDTSDWWPRPHYGILKKSRSPSDVPSVQDHNACYRQFENRRHPAGQTADFHDWTHPPHDLIGINHPIQFPPGLTRHVSSGRFVGSNFLRAWIDRRVADTMKLIGLLRNVLSAKLHPNPATKMNQNSSQALYLSLHLYYPKSQPKQRANFFARSSAIGTCARDLQWIRQEDVLGGTNDFVEQTFFKQSPV